MNSTAKIQFSDNQNDVENEIFIGDRFREFLKSFQGLSTDALNNFTKSTTDILTNCVPPTYGYNVPVSNTGLVFGYVQSGKTMSFTGLISLASDNGYKLIIVLAGTTRILLEQTTDRLRQDLNDRNAYEIISDDSKLYQNPSLIADKISNPERNRTVIMTILKHHKHIHEVTKILSTRELKQALKNRSVLIIDDEADQASLNGFSRRNWMASKKKEKGEVEFLDQDELFKFTTTYNNIIKLKSEIDCHTYIQYTATPQANILAAQRDLLKPSWAVVLEPGEKYTGGSHFFNENSELIIQIEDEDETEDPEMPDSLQDAFLLFLVESSLLAYGEKEFKGVNRLRGKMTRTSMMVHADRLIGVNSTYKRWLVSFSNVIREGIKSNEPETIHTIHLYYEKAKIILNNYFDIFPSFDDVLKVINYYVLDELKFWFVAGDGDNQVKWNDSNHHVLIGGQKLDRGFTVNELIVTYLPRQTKSISNADTIEQRCRFFGYKKDYIEACRVYLPEKSIEEFHEYVKHEEKLRQVLKNGPITNYYDNDILMRLVGLNPTSQNKIPGYLIRSDFFNYKFLEPDLMNIDKNNTLISNFLSASVERGELYFDKKNKSPDNVHFVRNTNVDNLIKLVSNIGSSRKKDDILLNHFKQLLEDLPLTEKVWVIEMAYKRDFRPRSLKESGELMALFTNHPPEFGDTKMLMTKEAGGDFYAEYNNELIIQLHKVKIKDLNKKNDLYEEYQGKVFNILAFRYPNSNSSNYIQFSYA